MNTTKLSKLLTEVIRDAAGYIAAASSDPSIFNRPAFGLLGPEYLLASKAAQLMKDTENIRKLLLFVESEPELANTFMVDAGGKPLKDDRENWALNNSLVTPLLKFYLKLEPTGFYNIQSARKAISAVKKEVRFNSVIQISAAPLKNTAVEGVIKINSEIEVRNLNEGEKNKIQGYGSMGLNSSPVPQQINAAIIFKKEVPKYSGLQVSPREILDTLSVLRLAKPGRLGIVSVYTFADPSNPFSDLGMASGGPLLNSPFIMGSQYRVSQTDQAEVRRIARKISAHNTPGSRFELALRRLVDSSYRVTPEDRIIDYWVALEALFLPEAQELSYRARLRISRFLGTSSQKRLRLLTLVKKSYGIRSKVVHGEIKDLSVVESVINETEEILRRSLREWLDKPANFSTEEIDKDLLS